MKTLLLAISLFVCFESAGLGQSKINGLPKGAVVVEMRKLLSPSHPNRTLVFWMINPKKNPTGYALDEVYSCPDQTRGSHYSGPTRVSLVNLATMNIMSTVKVSSRYEDGGDSFDVPYAIRKGNYYRVEGPVREGVEARPTILWLKDYNGDGKPFEFALFEAEACMGIQTTLIGYSEKQDRVIQYPIKLEVVAGSKHSTRMTPWADYLFSKKPLRPGFWRYEIDYRGRAGSLDKWEVRYNSAREQFEGTLIIVPGE
ncbi:MAG TPA: hypothetical protein VEM96_18885 [Pyrinomonadaceae bacterium]|nr:hypothetical protein [Pyrinomonadaceae bacterium]